MHNYINLDGDPPLEVRTSLDIGIMGFSAKHDSGNVRLWGAEKINSRTEWIALGGPVIGLNFMNWYTPLSLIVGDECRPKYFGARNLSVRPGEKREVIFYWQISHAEYFSVCLTKGLFSIQDYEQLDWIDIDTKKTIAVLYPSPQNLYSSSTYLSINYKHETKVVRF